MTSTKHFLAALLLLTIGLYTTSCNTAPLPVTNNMVFADKLSAYRLFEGDMYTLQPAAGVEVLDIASALFTDYAEKQRLVKVPAGQTIVLAGNGLPVFPEGTILAKTFYYSKAGAGRREIIETRLLIFKDGQWNAATYRWDTTQTEANLLTDGAVVPVTFQNAAGNKQTIAYQVPAGKDCAGCHRSGDALTPIGPTAQHLNISVTRKGGSLNQLTYLMQQQIVQQSAISSITTLPDYHDTSLPIAARARAYLQMNCAHCHQPGGAAGNASLNLLYTAQDGETGIGYNKQHILVRMSVMGAYHMPKTGTTVLDEEGVRLIKQYITSLP
ncbi:c-type cytochrome [Chitinophaga rhizophila]|uniref:C-type cytochrome n=1 Tax=Chitinophaga rhizophila TaxID=2866212 RepID=A0ABS7GH87_9BACT|nr:c-type cytochrome [Chitinophaga rhizophila]MBW8687052.1 c-type cytochrome [Chitinophaga rhizophila]